VIENPGKVAQVLGGGGVGVVGSREKEILYVVHELKKKKVGIEGKGKVHVNEKKTGAW